MLVEHSVKDALADRVALIEADGLVRYGGACGDSYRVDRGDRGSVQVWSLRAVVHNGNIASC